MVSRTGLNKFWEVTVAWVLAGSLATFAPLLDIPVYWPILLVYFLFISASVYSKQRAHMARYGYSLSDFFRKNSTPRAG